ncbi:MAG: DUF4105 domain-containing protein [Flavobacteriaceae bacterium]
MALRLLFLSISLVSTLVASAQESLSKVAQISVLTCSEGPELHAAFGHNAIHVYDPGKGIDEVYNYGTFDFGAPNFYVNFVKGKLDYFLSVTDYKTFSAYYAYVGREVVRQTLNLTQDQKEEIYRLLVENEQPENRHYRYDFLKENCATKIPELLAQSLGEDFKMSTVYDGHDLTYRSTLHEHLSLYSWNRFGIDIVLGARVDQTLNTSSLVYLPKYLKSILNTSTSDSRPLVQNTHIELKKNLPQATPAFWTSPRFVLLVLMIYALLSLWLGKAKGVFKLLDHTILLLAGVAGVLLTFLNFFAEHYATAYNFSLFWANPLLLAAITLRSKTLFQSVSLLSLLFILIGFLGIQYLSIEMAFAALLIVALSLKQTQKL